MHRFLISVILFSSSYVLAQDSKRLYQTKKIATNKTIVLDSLSINPSYFKITDSNGVSVDTDSYFIDFKKAVLNFKNMLPQTDSIEVTYLKYPEFLTKTYKQIDASVIVNSTGTLDKLYQISESNPPQETVPFDGLTTSGSISRGVTIGNNQNSVLNSELDLQISGKIS